MKVYIGPYKYWLGPYQLAECLQKVGFSEDTCEKIGDWLNKTYVKNICEWIDERKRRKVKVKLHDYDTFNLDDTLGLIILPCMLRLRECKEGAPFVDNDDVPDHLKSDSHNFDIMKSKWNYILDEIIFAFKSQQEDWEKQFTSGETDWQFKEAGNGYFEMIEGPNHTYKIDIESRNMYQARITNGFRLFGKYYQALWT